MGCVDTAGRPITQDLITARAGRIDSSADTSELVLQDAMKTKVPAPDARGQSYVVERLDLLRIVFNTGRASLLARLQKPEGNPDEMGLAELRQRAEQTTGAEQRDARMIFHKRLALAVTPFVFSFFGAALGLRMRRGSRGFGVLLSLLIMLVYYLARSPAIAGAGHCAADVGRLVSHRVHAGDGSSHRRPGRETSFLPRRDRRPQQLRAIVPACRRRPRRRRRLPVSTPDTVSCTMILSFGFGFITLV